MAKITDDIERYRKGELTAAEMHALEKKALSDPFLAEALEGAESVSPENFSADLNEIDQYILSKGKKTVWFTPLRIAAGVALLIGSAFMIYQISQPEERLALQKEQTPPINLADSLADKNKPELLSLNQPKEDHDNETKIVDQTNSKIETGPTATKTEGTGEAKPTAGISSTQVAPTLTDEQAKADQPTVAELSEIKAEEKFAEREEAKAAEPPSTDLKKEALEKDIVTRAKARKSVAADDVQKQVMISGQVTSLEDGLPLPGVNVQIKGATTGTVTDVNGNYSIPLENEKQKLVFSFIGLQTTEISPDNKSAVDVKLPEDISQLSEVVVTGQGFKSDRDENESPVVRLAEPFGGRKAYDTYLEKNLRYPQQALDNHIKGKVIIEFTVGTDGALSDFNVMRSLGHGCDDEVLRLVKEGPKWYPSTEDNVAIESNVRVKMKFDPAKAKK